MTRIRTSRIIFGLLALLLAPAPAAPAGEVAVTIEDESEFHVYPPGRAFTVTVTVSDPGARGAISATWVDADRQPLADPVALTPGEPAELTSPGDAVGFYGLQFSCDNRAVAFPPQEAGFGSSLYGFAILPEAGPIDERPREPDSFWGMVHANISDPYLRGGIKTLTWRTSRASSWSRQINDRRRAVGLEELPIVSGDEWDADHGEPLSDEFLRELRSKLRDYFAAAPDVDWELGREENRHGRFRERCYFQNLAAKVTVAREERERVGAEDMRFVMQLEGFDYRNLDRFFDSEAAELFDVISLHPYPWEDFPEPESWLEEHVEHFRELMEKKGRPRPIWFTEIGIPIRGNNNPDGFFGYPRDRNSLPGATQAYAARYIVKCHLVAAKAGVERVYWYNYQNRGDDIEYAEDNFGLRTHSGSSRRPGYPLPIYVAYAMMVHNLGGKTLRRAQVLGDTIHCYEYRAAEGDAVTVVLWRHPAGEERLSWSGLQRALSNANLRFTGVEDLYGTPREMAGDGVTVTGDPLYLHGTVSERRD